MIKFRELRPGDVIDFWPPDRRMSCECLLVSVRQLPRGWLDMTWLNKNGKVTVNSSKGSSKLNSGLYIVSRREEA